MGTTRSFLLLKNRGFTREELERLIPAHIAQEKEGAQKMRRHILQRMGLDEKLLAMLTELDNGSCHGVVAYREDARWLPYFLSELCDGHVFSSRELKQTSEQFETPVLGFSIFDSDDLFVCYFDAAEQVSYDYIKPRCPEAGEYDPEVYQEGLPIFLLSLDREDTVQQIEDIQRLKELWDGGNPHMDADDRMYNLLQFLGMQVIYDEKDEIDGYILIRG